MYAQLILEILLSSGTGMMTWQCDWGKASRIEFFLAHSKVLLVGNKYDRILQCVRSLSRQQGYQLVTEKVNDSGES